MIGRFLTRRLACTGGIRKNILGSQKWGLLGGVNFRKLQYGFGQIPDDLESFNQERLRKSEVLKVRNQAKQMMEKERIQNEELAKKGQMTPQEIMKQLIQVKTTNQFSTKLVENEKPSVLFIYASWCKVSEQVLPTVLDQYSHSNRTWNIAVFDIDDCKELTNLLGVDKTPTALLIDNGDVVDSMKGLPSQTEFSQFFTSLSKIIEIKLRKKEYELLLSEIHEYYKQKDFNSALEKIELLRGFKVDKASSRIIDLIHVDSLMETKNHSEAKKRFSELKDDLTEESFSDENFKVFYEDVESRVMAEVEDPEFEKLKNEFLIEPDNLEVCYKFAMRAKEVEKFELCIELLLKILEKDKGYENALEEIKEVFVVLGSSNELVRKSRRELSMILH